MIEEQRRGFGRRDVKVFLFAARAALEEVTMKRMLLVPVVLGLLCIAMAPVVAKGADLIPQPTTAVTVPAAPAVVTPVRWYRTWAYPGWYDAPGYYYSAPVYPYTYVYPGWRSYYGPGVYYSGPRRSFYFGYWRGTCACEFGRRRRIVRRCCRRTPRADE